MPAAQRATAVKKESRRRMIAAIQIQWKQLRPDLRHAPDELRDERLAFCANVLNLRHPLGSVADLTDRQLGKVLDALKEMQSQPRLPNCEVPQRPIAQAEIIHLASPEQVYTINKLLLHLGWGPDAQKAFMRRRFKRENPVHLRPREAQSLIRILFNIACSQELKERGFAKVTRKMIALQIPALKARLGIDRREPHPNQEQEVCQQSLISSADRSDT